MPREEGHTVRININADEIQEAIARFSERFGHLTEQMRHISTEPSGSSWFHREYLSDIYRNNLPGPDSPTPRRRTPGTPEGRQKSVQLIFSDELYRFLHDYRRRDRIVRYLIDEQYRLDTSRINYVGMHNGKLTYLPAGRPLVTLPDHTWASAGRQEAKAARVARMLIPKDEQENFTDADFERFSNLIKSTDATKRTEFVMVEGAEIREWYDGDRYFYGSGSLDSSCMRHDHCQDYFRLYEDNPDIIKMLCLIDTEENLLRGRALVWFVPGCDTPIMDRVYGTDATKVAFREYAEKQGWYSRAFNSYEREMVFIKGGETVYLDICVQLPNYRYAQYPYLDTMKYFQYATGVVTNNRRRRYDATLMNTHGEGAPYRWWQIAHCEDRGGNFVHVITEQDSRLSENWYGASEWMGEMEIPDLLEVQGNDPQPIHLDAGYPEDRPAVFDEAIMPVWDDEANVPADPTPPRRRTHAEVVDAPHRPPARPRARFCLSTDPQPVTANPEAEVATEPETAVDRFNRAWLQYTPAPTYHFTTRATTANQLAINPYADDVLIDNEEHDDTDF